MDHEFQANLSAIVPPARHGAAYKLFYLKDGLLYPPMVANPGGVCTPMGVWLKAAAGTPAPPSVTGRPRVWCGGKGTHASKGTLAYRPGWHLAEIPWAPQFMTGTPKCMPPELVWAECLYGMDRDYQEEAMSYGYTPSGKFRHAFAGLPRVPDGGYYRYRTNPDPRTPTWIITGEICVLRILSKEEVDRLCQTAGVGMLNGGSHHDI